jgi:hypothetical protein
LFRATGSSSSSTSAASKESATDGAFSFFSILGRSALACSSSSTFGAAVGLLIARVDSKS